MVLVFMHMLGGRMWSRDWIGSPHIRQKRDRLLLGRAWCSIRLAMKAHAALYGHWMIRQPYRLQGVWVKCSRGFRVGANLFAMHMLEFVPPFRCQDWDFGRSGRVIDRDPQ